MTQQNNIAVEIPAETMQRITDGIARLQADLAPFMVSLTPDQKMGMAKMGDATVAFVNKAITYTESNPEFVPSFLNVHDMVVDGNVVSLLAPVSKIISQISANLEDTLTLSGSEAYIAALIYYNAVKAAAKNSIPGAKTIYEDLSQRFPGRRKTRRSTNDPAQ